jgi:hypothetical protein
MFAVAVALLLGLMLLTWGAAIWATFGESESDSHEGEEGEEGEEQEEREANADRRDRRSAA